MIKVEPGQAHAQIDSVVARDHGQTHGENRGQRGEIAKFLQQAFELGRDLDGGGRDLEERTQVARGARNIAGIPRHACRVLQDLAATRPVGKHF